MPSISPLPARRIEISASFLPSSIGACIVVSGVSTVTVVISSSRVTS